jgi:hypothetical protein
MSDAYKYDTPDEWLRDYAMGGRYDPKEVSPEIVAFAEKHDFDIPRMSAALRPDGKIVAALPIPIRLPCPMCHELHVDTGRFATHLHHTHACQFCGHVWRPAIVCTVGVRFLPGFRDEDTAISRGQA